MNFSVCAPLLVALAATPVWAQEDLPVLRTNTPNIQIIDDDRPTRGDWVIDASIPVDTYYAIRSDKRRVITFKSDIESKSFTVDPGRTYDFIILLNDHDACRTRISTEMAGLQRIGQADAVAPITIPISIQHGKLHLNGRINGSQPLDLIFDTGADSCVVYPSALAKGAQLVFDDSVLNAGTGGVTRRALSRGTTLEIANARWEQEKFIRIEKQADRADGIVGYTIFENKVVELDYDRMVMTVHEVLPANAANFSKTPVHFVGSLPGVDVEMSTADKKWQGRLVLDTAGTGAMLVNRAFGVDNNLHALLPGIGTGTARGVGAAQIRTDLRMLPTLSIAGHALSSVPINVESESSSSSAPPGGVICMDVLSRLNTIIDFPRSEVYFKPNASFAEPFRVRSSRYWPYAVLAGVGGVFLTSGAIVLFRARRRTRK